MSLDQLPPGVPLSAIPLGINPDGSPPNFVNPPSLAPAVLAVGVTFASFSTALVILKLLSIFSVLALFTAFAYTGVAISFRDTQAHMWDIPASALTEAYVKKTTALGFLYGLCAWAGKMALLLLLHRIFNLMMTFRKLLYLGMILVSCAHLSAIPIYAALCRPLKGQHWDLAMLNGRCAKPTSIHTVVVGAIGTALDIYIWLLPLPLIFALHLELKRSIGVAVVFMAGLFAVIASGVAMYYRVLMYRGEDLSWNVARAYICVFAETYVIIMVGCAPGVAALWRGVSISESTCFTSVRSFLGSGDSTSRLNSDSKKQSGSSSVGTKSQKSQHPLQDPNPHNIEKSPSNIPLQQVPELPRTDLGISKTTQVKNARAES